MVTVSTKEAFKQALKNKESKIIVTGDLAREMRKRSKIKKTSKIGGLTLAIAGIVAIPFTAGASAGLTAVGLTALTVGTVSLTAAELAILCGFVLGMAAILSGAHVEFKPDGTVIVTPKYKGD